MSGTTPSTNSLGKLFSKGSGDSKDPKAEVPQVPVERLVASPRKQIGRGRRDTILTGADGLQ